MITVSRVAPPPQPIPAPTYSIEGLSLEAAQVLRFLLDTCVGGLHPVREEFSALSHRLAEKVGYSNQPYVKAVGTALYIDKVEL